MPSRLACIAILLFWVAATAALISRDVLPELQVGTPPDLRTIARAEARARPTRWAIQVAETGPDGGFRSVGQAQTDSQLQADGWIAMHSSVWFDSGNLLRGTPFQTDLDERIVVESQYTIDPSGNLYSFRATVRSPGVAGRLLDLEGRVERGELRVQAKGPLPILNWSRSFPYEPRGMVQNAVAPIDRMPGLHVGQRWDTKVISPLTGRVETVRVEVVGKELIYWDKSPVTALTVVTHAAPASFRTWVRPDGLVLRSEVPVPFVKMLLERLPDPDEAGEAPR